jgi:predicted dinucleotide-binding enzyme
MNISIIGAGNIGGTLGKKLAAAGYEILFGVRDPDSGKTQRLLDKQGRLPERIRLGSLAETAAFSEVLILAIQFNGVRELLAALGDLSGKLIIDATNPFPNPPEGYASGGQAVEAWSGGARVAKAFNSTGWENLANPAYGSQKAEILICGSDAESRQTAARLAQAVGVETIDLGGLENAALTEAMARLWVGLARSGLGREIAFKLMRR